MSLVIITCLFCGKRLVRLGCVFRFNCCVHPLLV
ncbi:unnamed protein product [Brassica oleracea]